MSMFDKVKEQVSANADKIKDQVSANADKIKAGVDKAADKIDEKTGNKYADKVDRVQDLAKEQVDKLDKDQPQA